MHSGLSRWLGIGLILAGIGLLGGAPYWVATRTFVPVDIPVSLSRGHIRTGEFKINMNAFYTMEIQPEQNPSGGIEFCGSPARDQLETQWVLKSRGRVVVESRRSSGNFPVQGCYLGGFPGEPGRYELEIEVLSDSSWLDAERPRLHLEAMWKDYNECDEIAGVWFAIGVFFVVIGVSLLSLSAFAPFRKFPQERPLRISTPRGNSYRVHRRELSLIDSQSTLSLVGYVYAVTWFFLFLAFAPFILGRFWNSGGIPVRLLRPGVIKASADHETGLLVYVDKSGRLYLNSKSISAEELPPALGDEFARRADWSVYVEGDSDADYRSVVQAMDLVRNAQGQVIMLTPKMRAEADRVAR